MSKSRILTKTSIEWTDRSWNPIRARHRRTGKIGWHCEHASEGCTRCYAETLNKLRGTGLDFIRQNREEAEPFLDEGRLRAAMPRQPAKIFVCDMTDLFAEFVPDEWVDCILGVAEFHPEHVYQVLTKRAARMRQYFALPGHRTNVWLGVSVEAQRELARLEIIRSIPAVLRFASFEPLLEDLGAIDLTGIGWVIVGGESDARRRARPMQLDWVRNLRDQCVAAGIPFFFKQDAVHGRKLTLPHLDGRQWREFPIVCRPGAV